MKNIFKLASAAAVVLALTQSLQAVPINGTLLITGSATLNSSSAGTATAVTAWVAPIITGPSTGAFSGISPLTLVTMSTAVWNFNTSTAINNFWSVGGFTFKLLSSSVTSQDGSSVHVSGMGTLTGPAGYDATAYTWTFTTQDPGNGGNPNAWSFSASDSPVPDGGSTVMLLGIALSGAALLRKKLTA